MWRTLQLAAPAFVPAVVESGPAARMPLLHAEACATSAQKCWAEMFEKCWAEVFDMFVTQKSLPRRTVLRGMGAAIALPFLDSMVPAFVPQAKAAALPSLRFGVVY